VVKCNNSSILLVSETMTALYIQADNFALPLPDKSVDLALAQNTLPCFEELTRMCRPGGMIVYVDTSAGWVVGLAKLILKRQGKFKTIIGERVDLGFYILMAV
jgi:ubiquinone/menaquinone biosynthesis C-methylase UbiE